MTNQVLVLTWLHIYAETYQLAGRVARVGRQWDGIYGVPTGGSIIAVMAQPIISAMQGGWPVKLLNKLDDAVEGERVVVVDDLIDTGATASDYAARYHLDALYRKPHSPTALAPDARLVRGWLAFPWEHEQRPIDAATRLVEYAAAQVDGIFDVATHAATLLNAVDSCPYDFLNWPAR